MKKLLTLLASVFLAVGFAHAQVTTNYWKLISGVLQPVNSSWTVNTGGGGATSTFGFITATTTTATSTFAGNVQVSGDLRVLGNFYAPVSIVTAGNITPSTDNVRVLGTTALRFFEARFGTGTTTFAGVVGIGTTTPLRSLEVATGSISVAEYDWGTATSTSMTVDWRRANTQKMRISTSAVTITHLNATSTLGAVLKLVVCNAGSGTAGAITWGNPIYWANKTVPTQTTTANNCDVWSFISTSATGTPVIFGSQTANF